MFQVFDMRPDDWMRLIPRRIRLAFVREGHALRVGSLDGYIPLTPTAQRTPTLSCSAPSARSGQALLPQTNLREVKVLTQLCIAFSVYVAIATLASLVARCLGLRFSPADEPEQHDNVGCYHTWAAHRCCPQGIPRNERK